MTTRKCLPNRRGHELLEFEHGGIRYVAGVGRFEDGELAEIFLSAAKHGTAVDIHVDTLRKALTRNGDGSASGPLAHALDLLAQPYD